MDAGTDGHGGDDAAGSGGGGAGGVSGGGGATTDGGSGGSGGGGASGMDAGAAGSGGGGAGGADGGGTGGGATDGGAGTAADGSAGLDGSVGDGNLSSLDQACTPKFTLRLLDTGPNGQAFMTAMGGSMAAVAETAYSIGRDVCRYLYRLPSEVRPTKELELTIEEFNGVASHSRAGPKVVVQISSRYLATLSGEALTREIKGILYHMMTHAYQNDDTPEGTWSGLADYYESHADAVRAHFQVSFCGNPNKSGNWDQGANCIRAHWWLFLENQYPDFLYKLNAQLKGGDGVAWAPDMGTAIANKTFETLWIEYTAATCCDGATRTCCK
jgi:hypothetical protein